MYFEKKGVKKIFILAIFAIALCVPLFVFSQGFGLPQTARKSGLDTGSGDIYKTIGNVTNVAFATIAFIFFALTVYAGICWVTARGQESLIEKAKSTMEQAIIGLIIVSLSYAIASFVVGRLGVAKSVPEVNNPGCCVSTKLGGDMFAYCKTTGSVAECKKLDSDAGFYSDFVCESEKAKNMGCFPD